ncbi:MAG: sugar kinase [Planctomycetaceae bacterium]|jgi:2-dehydro-3-deoxygluconokinase|nr:sugar kinase [Planctomycetaceae bacterium]
MERKGNSMNVITFGEIMGRLAPEGNRRFSQAMPGTVSMSFAGAEANVAVSVALLGGESAYCTVLPKHAVAEACLCSVRALGVDTSRIIRSDHGRLGLYYLETGANQRSSNVIYDRSGSSLAIMPPEQYDWDVILNSFSWLHLTGITPSLSRNAAQATQDAAETAKKYGMTVSMDLNFRKKLWAWNPPVPARELAEKTLRKILPSVDLVIANESDCADVLGIHAQNSDTEKGNIDIRHYPAVAQEVVQQFPNIQKVAITLRESISATHNNWGGMLYDARKNEAFFAPLDTDGNYKPYEIRAIVDRVGAGDSFGAALIFALTTDELSDSVTAIRFAAASSCLAHSISGDFNYVTRSEVESLMAGDTSGRVKR